MTESDITPNGKTNGRPRHRRGLLIAAGALVVGAGSRRRDLRRHPRRRRLEPDTAVTSTTSANSTLPTVPTTLPVDTSTAVWPAASSSTRYSDPVSAARGFATDYVGFTDPIVGEFQQGDAAIRRGARAGDRDRVGHDRARASAR